MKCIKNRQKGYTMLEIMVVIALLGIITAVALPHIVKFMNRGETEAAWAELHNVQVAASAAAHEGGGQCVEEPSDSTGIIEVLPGGPADRVGTYLINDTSWEYQVTAFGVVEQGDRAK